MNRRTMPISSWARKERIEGVEHCVVVHSPANEVRPRGVAICNDGYTRFFETFKYEVEFITVDGNWYGAMQIEGVRHSKVVGNAT